MATQFPARKARVYLAFTYRDRHFYEALVNHLAPLHRLGIIDNWHEYAIPPAKVWQQAQNERLMQADIILLLISPDFMASDYHYSIQNQALERNTAGNARVLPILCRSVYLEDLPIGKLQFLPRSGPQGTKAISLWDDEDEVYAEIVKEVRKAIADFFSSSPIQFLPRQGTASQQQGTRYLVTYKGHRNYVISTVWSSDGKYIASGGGDNTVRVWDATTGNTLYTYHIHKSTSIRPSFASEVWSIIWSPDSTRIAFAGKGAPIVWSPQRDQIRATYKGHASVLRVIAAMSWSPDGKYIATTNLGSFKDQNIHIWNPENGQLFAKIDLSSGLLDITAIGGVAWASDSRRIACGLKGEIRIYDTYAKRLLQTYKNASDSSYFHVCWSRDATRLVCAVPKEAVVWDTTTGKLLQHYIAHTADIRDVAISPDGKHVATGSNDKTIHIWETDTARLIFKYEGHKDQISSVTWSPDGKRVASACKDGTVHVWQAI